MTRLPALRPRPPPTAVPGAANPASAHQPRLSRLVLEQSDSYVRAMAAARERPSCAAVHELRVATRRLLALRELVSFVDPCVRNGMLERYLATPFRPCGRLRDLQVIERRVRALLPRFPEAERLLSELKPRQRKARMRAARALDRAHPRRIARLLRNLAGQLDELAADRAGRDRATRRVALKIEAAGRIAQTARQRAQTGDPELIHQSRLALKSLRYMVELAASLGLRFVPSEVGSLSRVQVEMGEITDRTMLLIALDAYRDKHPRTGARMAHLRRTVEQERRRLISRYLVADTRAPRRLLSTQRRAL